MCTERFREFSLWRLLWVHAGFFRLRWTQSLRFLHGVIRGRASWLQRSVPDLLPYRDALYHSLRECVFSAGHVRRIYSLFPHTDGECVCHICFRLVSDLLQDTAFRENEDTVIPVSIRISIRDVYEKPLVLRFTPSADLIAAALAWILLLLLFTALASRKRKTERTGRIFAVLTAERIAEAGISFLAGVWAAGFALDLSGMMESGGIAAWGMAVLVSAAVAAAVHCLLEIVLKNPGSGILRRKWQLAASCAASAAVCIVFPAGASSYDTYFPDEASGVSISIDGLGMTYDIYQQVQGDREDYETDDQLEKYTLTGDGKSAALGWLKEIAASGGNAKNTSAGGTQSGTDAGDPGGVFTWAAVCYHLEDGSEHYRTYPISEEQAESFAAVYETAEYKQIAYPGVNLAEAGEDRFTWDDGVTGTAMKMTAEEKESLLEAYREDVKELEMAELKTVLPAGHVEVRASRSGNVTELVVYPFFERTCSILEETGVDIGKTLKDYPVESVEVRESLFSAPKGSAGGVSTSFYEEPGEVAEWKEKLVPEKLDVQPLLYPLDHSKEIKAEIEEEETSSLIRIDCAVMPGR